MGQPLVVPVGIINSEDHRRKPFSLCVIRSKSALHCARKQGPRGGTRQGMPRWDIMDFDSWINFPGSPSQAGCRQKGCRNELDGNSSMTCNVFE